MKEIHPLICWMKGVHIFLVFPSRNTLFFFGAQLTKGYYVMKKSEGADQVDFFKSQLIATFTTYQGHP